MDVITWRPGHRISRSAVQLTYTSAGGDSLMKHDAQAFRGEGNLHILFLDPGGGGCAQEILVLLARFEHSKL
jgi:hypothetical protein